ncbi:MAG: hypothetical protein M3O22_06495 [Pseudomonadota bacterium]|nr:hypothetical protein [Pseudomonadota bacterium]
MNIVPAWARRLWTGMKVQAFTKMVITGETVIAETGEMVTAGDESWALRILRRIPAEAVAGLLGEQKFSGNPEWRRFWNSWIGRAYQFHEERMQIQSVVQKILESGNLAAISFLKSHPEFSRISQDILMFALGVERASEEALDSLLQGTDETGRSIIYGRYRAELQNRQWNPDSFWTRRFSSWAPGHPAFRDLARKNLLKASADPAEVREALEKDRSLLTRDDLYRAAFEAEKAAALATRNDVRENTREFIGLLLKAMGQDSWIYYEAQRSTFLKAEIESCGKAPHCIDELTGLVRLALIAGDVPNVDLAMRQPAAARVKGSEVAGLVAQAFIQKAPDVAPLIMGQYLRGASDGRICNLLEQLQKNCHLPGAPGWPWIGEQLATLEPGQMDDLLAVARLSEDWPLVANMVRSCGARMSEAALGYTMALVVGTGDIPSTLGIIEVLNNVAPEAAAKAWKAARNNGNERCREVYTRALAEKFGPVIRDAITAEQAEIQRLLVLETDLVMRLHGSVERIQDGKPALVPKP